VPSPREQRARPALAPWVAALLAVELVAAAVGIATMRSERPTPVPVTTRARVAPPARLDVAREQAVRALLAARARAIREHDRAAWLATVDPTQPAFVARQAAVYDALAGLPLADWDYQLDPAAPPPAPLDLDRTRGPGWWAPGVTLTYRLAGYDEHSTYEPQRLTFVPHADGWLLAADDDFAATGHDTTRGLWDSGPVVVLRGRSCLVLGHPGSRALMRQVADGIDAAVPRVTRVWGPGWSQRVVALVPRSAAELSSVIGGTGDYSRVAAVATAELVDPTAGYHPVGDRVLVNPQTFGRLGGIGRQVVLTHEVTHVATRQATGAAVPAWLVEGLADYVGYLDAGLPLRLSAAELRDAVRRGQSPVQLPSEHDYDGSNPDLAKVYEEGWLAVSLLVAEHGQTGLLRLYRTVGQGRDVDAALHDLWGSDLATFTAEWRHDLTTRLR